MPLSSTLRRRLFLGAFAAVALLVGLLALYPNRFPGGDIVVQKVRGKYTVAERVEQFGPTVKARWEPFFAKAELAYPPQQILLVAFKEEKRLDVFASNNDDANQDADWKWVRSLPILRASGKMGPKLREGDLQVPEGVYHVESLNPNSAFHLSLRVSYPSSSDKAIAEKEARPLDTLGGDIMIHGGAASVGCLAMGDDAAEDLFVLAAQTAQPNAEIWICPLDFRQHSAPTDPNRPGWVKKRYAQLAAKLAKLPVS